ncbi:MAG: hypothetical protein ACP5N1_04560 [Candidatus Woesearchaeota archaeon]
MRVQYKQKCAKCKKNYVLATSRTSYVLCYDCQKGTLSGEITDPAFKKLFDIPEEYYKENAFLRNIKANYIKYGSLTESQYTAFNKVVEKIKEDKKA